MPFTGPYVQVLSKHGNHKHLLRQSRSLASGLPQLSRNSSVKKRNKKSKDLNREAKGKVVRFRTTKYNNLDEKKDSEKLHELRSTIARIKNSFFQYRQIVVEDTAERFEDSGETKLTKDQIYEKLETLSQELHNARTEVAAILNQISVCENVVEGVSSSTSKQEHLPDRKSRHTRSAPTKMKISSNSKKKSITGKTPKHHRNFRKNYSRASHDKVFVSPLKGSEQRERERLRRLKAKWEKDETSNDRLRRLCAMLDVAMRDRKTDYQATSSLLLSPERSWQDFQFSNSHNLDNSPKHLHPLNLRSAKRWNSEKKKERTMNDCDNSDTGGVSRKLNLNTGTVDNTGSGKNQVNQNDHEKDSTDQVNQNDHEKDSTDSQGETPEVTEAATQLMDAILGEVVCRVRAETENEIKEEQEQDLTTMVDGASKISDERGSQERVNTMSESERLQHEIELKKQKAAQAEEERMLQILARSSGTNRKKRKQRKKGSQREKTAKESLLELYSETYQLRVRMSRQQHRELLTHLPRNTTFLDSTPLAPLRQVRQKNELKKKRRKQVVVTTKRTNTVIASEQKETSPSILILPQTSSHKLSLLRSDYRAKVSELNSLRQEIITYMKQDMQAAGISGDQVGIGSTTEEEELTKKTMHFQLLKSQEEELRSEVYRLEEDIFRCELRRHRHKQRKMDALESLSSDLRGERPGWT
eukprot:g1278.t1